jgi:predicted DCC family thiol-disulfide oxidoreductase YuxK
MNGLPNQEGTSMKGSGLFVNYFADDSRESPLNLAFARILLGIYILWRGASIDAVALTQWPFAFVDAHSYLIAPESLSYLMVASKWLLLASTIAFIVGYRLRVSSLLTAFLFAQLASAMMVLNDSGETEQMLVGASLVLFFGLYAEQDRLSVDAIRRTASDSLADLNTHLKQPDTDTYRLEPLKWVLLTMGLVYFGAGYSKLTAGVWGWTSPDNLARYIVLYTQHFHHELWVGTILRESPLLLSLSTWGTIVVELSLLIAILVGVTITPIILSLYGMHVVITAAMGIFFLDILFFLGTLFAFDRAFAWLATDREIDVVYDEHCFFCARSLYPFKYLDINETVTFYSQYTAPKEYAERNDVEFDDEMYVFIDGEVYGGYYAFQQLLSQFPISQPLSWLMIIPGVSIIGERIYENIAANRNRYFVCSINSGPDTSD